MRPKIAALALYTTLFVGLAAGSSHIDLSVDGNDWGNDPYTITYANGESNSVSVVWDESSAGTAPETLTMRLCGTSQQTRVNRGSRAGVGPEEVSYSFNLQIPQNFPCSQGRKTVLIDNGGTNILTKELIVEARGMDPNAGPQLFIKLNPADDKLHNMFLTEDTQAPAIDTSGFQDLRGTIYIDDIDTLSNEACLYNMSTGVLDSGEAIADNLYGGDDESTDGIGCFPASTKVDKPGAAALTPFGQEDLISSDSTGLTADIRRPDAVGHSLSLSSWTPVHADGEFQIDKQSQLFLGHELVDSDPVQVEPQEWLLCRRGMDGRTASKNQNIRHPNYRCDTKGNGNGWRDNEAYDWEKVEECRDGVDNDNDGQTDYPSDTECSSPTDNAETDNPVDTCEPFIGLEEDVSTVFGNQDIIAAYYDSSQGTANPFGEGCNYKVETIKDALGGTVTPDAFPKEFTCTRSGGSGTSSDPGITNSDPFCQEVMESTSSSPVRHDHSEVGSTAAVKYVYPRSVLPFSPEAVEVDEWNIDSSQTSVSADELVRDSDQSLPDVPRAECADGDAGLVIKACETLHHAEYEYTDTGVHEASTWARKEMWNTSEYEPDIESDGQTDYRNSWAVANAGPSGKVASQPKPVYSSTSIASYPGATPPTLLSGGDVGGGDTSDFFFSGGFAGKCGGDFKWGYVENPDSSGKEWRCTGQAANQQTIQVEFLDITLQNNMTGKTTGFRIPWNELQKWYNAYPNAPNISTGARQNGGTAGGPLQVKGMCWVGGPRTGKPGSVPESTAYVFAGTSTVQNGEPLYMVSELPYRPHETVIDGNLIQIDHQTFTCVYALQQQVDNPDNIEDQRRLVGSGGSSYIAEGVDESGIISTTATRTELSMTPSQEENYLRARSLGEISGSTLTPQSGLPGDFAEYWALFESSGGPVTSDSPGSNPLIRFQKQNS